MFIRRKLLPALSISLLISSCGGGGGGGTNTSGNDGDENPPITEVPVGNVPDGLIHAPLTIQEPAHSFYNLKVHPDGRLTGLAFLDTLEQIRLFSTGPVDFSSATLLTPNPVREIDFSYPADRSVYLEDGILYSKDANAPTQLSGTEKVDQFWLSPDQNRILYIANESTTRVIDPITNQSTYFRRNELYSVDVQGGNRVKLSIAAPESNVIYDNSINANDPHSRSPQFLPDMSRVVYMVRPESTGLTELHSVLVDGTGRVVLNADIETTSSAVDNSFVFSFTANSSHIIYGVRNADIMELYSITPDGNSNTKISGPLVSGGSVSARRQGFTVASSPDSSFVVYLASAESPGTNELYRVSLDGTGLTKLSNGLNVSDRYTTFVDNNTLVYFANDLYAVSTSGGTSTKLNNGFTFGYIPNLQLTLDKTSVVYVARDNATSQERLFISKLDGSSSIDLSDPMIAQGNVYSPGGGNPSFILDPTGTGVVYSADAEVRFKREIYSVNLDGTNRQKLSPAPLHTGSTRSLISGFSDNKLYFAYDANTQGRPELYAYDYSNGTATNISANWPEFITEDVSTQKMVQSTNGAVQAFASEKSTFMDSAIIIRTPASSCRIDIADGVRVLGGRANFLIEPTGNALYYTLLGESANWQFYRAQTSDCSTTNINSGISESLERMILSTDGLKMAFSGTDGGLYITATDGSDVKEVNANRTMGGIEIINNGAFAVSHDSKSIVYWGIEDTADVVELYYATIDGLSHGKINGPLITDGEVYNDGFNFVPVISPDDQWVIYPARQDALVWELYKSKLDGSSNTRISGNLANSEINVDNEDNLLQVTADSTKLVYQTRESVSNITNLYSVNLNGSPTPVKLNPDLANGGRVLDYKGITLTPNSRSVVYVSRESSEAPHELFVVNLDGTGHTKLNSTLLTDEDVINFSLSNNGSKVVYVTGYQNNDLTGLHVSNIDGSSPILIAFPEPIDGDYSQTPPRLTSDNRVVFRATIDTVDGIYIMPITGGTPSLVVDIPANRNLEDVFIANDGQIMVIGDLRLPGVFEVFNYNI